MGVPVLTTNNGSMQEIITNKENGYLVDELDYQDVSISIKNLINDDIEQNIGSETFSGYHLIGTNRMSDDKNSGVVDESFKVFGIKNLYVCDASIFPDFVLRMCRTVQLPP